MSRKGMMFMALLFTTVSGEGRSLAHPAEQLESAFPNICTAGGLVGCV